MASLMMVSANDAAYAVAEAQVGGSISGFATDRERDREALRHARQHVRRPGRPHRHHFVQRRAEGQRVRPRDRGPQRAHGAGDRAVGRHAARTTSPTRRGCTTSSTTTTSSCPATRFGYEGANGFKTGYTEIAGHTLVATAKRNGRQCIAVILGSSDSGYTWAASLLDQCWEKPPVATTGTVLPPVAVSPYARRAPPQARLHRARGRQHRREARGRRRASDGEGHDHRHATPAAASPLTASADWPPPRAAGTIHRRHALASKHHGLLTPTRHRVACSSSLLVAAFVLRRRAVKRQRARRIARQRARAKAMRSGSLPVVDGRYRTGTRVGQPVESRVRVERSHIDLTEEERPPVRRSPGAIAGPVRRTRRAELS